MNQQAFRQASQKSPGAIPIEVNRIEGREMVAVGVRRCRNRCIDLGDHFLHSPLGQSERGRFLLV